MPAESPAVSVVLLCHNRPETLEAALRSVEAQSCRPAQALVVDNRSPGSAAIAEIVRRHPAFTLIANPVNGGFTGGMNLGLRYATGEYVFITEEDIVLEPDCLEKLLQHVTANPAPALVSGIMVDDQDRILSAGGRIHLGRIYQLELIARGEKDAGQFDAPFDVGYITGAMIFARRDVWIALGGFRDDFFIYHDDTDLSLRALRAGFRITIVPAARERHLTAQGMPSDFVEYHKFKNFIALYLLHAPLSVVPEFLARYVVLPLVRPGSPKRRPLWRAVVWNARHAGRMLRDRGRVRPSTADAFARPTVRSQSLLGSLFHRLAPRVLREARIRSVLLREAEELARHAEGVTDLLTLSRLAIGSPAFSPLQRESEIVRFLETVKALAPRRLCEIGTASGGTSFLLARSSPPGATLVTVDLGARTGQAEALVALAGAGRTIHPLLGDSRDPRMVERVRAAAGGPLDLLLIDGDHRYEGVHADFEAYRPLMGPGGVIAFHDIVPDSRSRGGADTGTDAGGVPRFWKEIKERFPGATTEIIERPDQDATGIGILRLGQR